MMNINWKLGLVEYESNLLRSGTNVMVGRAPGPRGPPEILHGCYAEFLREGEGSCAKTTLV